MIDFAGVTENRHNPYWAVRFKSDERFRLTGRLASAEAAKLEAFGMSAPDMVAIPFNRMWRNLTQLEKNTITRQLGTLRNEPNERSKHG